MVDEATLQAILDDATLEEQVSLLAGATDWTTVAIPRIGVPSIKVSDGPNGARGGGSLQGETKGACFPCGIALSSSWDRSLSYEIGTALAAETKTKGARVLLGPTVNIHRSTLNGRNFETYSEDPYLTAEIAVPYIKGLQDHGVAGTIKHFAGNESEFQRTSISSEIDERTLREIYLPPFEAAVKRANVWAVMSAYNKVNGTFASENCHLLTEILKEEWGFDGIVMSDWFGSHTTAETVIGGLDLEMPGPTRDRGEKLVQAVREGRVPAEAVRKAALRMLRIIARVGAFEDPIIPEQKAVDLPADRALIRKAGAKGTVLLKNDGLLPLDANNGLKVAIIGPNAKTAQIMGGGSAQLDAHYRISPYEGIVAALGGEDKISYALGCTNQRVQPTIKQPFVAEFFSSLDLSGEVIHRAEAAESEFIWWGPITDQVDRQHFSLRAKTTLTADVTGNYLFGLISVGPARVLVNGQQLITTWDDWKQGGHYFEQGNDEVSAEITLEAGKTYEVVAEYKTAPEMFFGFPAIRVGCSIPVGDADIEEAVRVATGADVAILCVGGNGEWDTEGQDRPNLDLPGRQDELIARVVAANPRTVVVLQTGAPVLMPWIESVPAVLESWYPGQEAGNSIADVLFGKVAPGGRLPQTFPTRLEDDPTRGNYPGADGKVTYGEGVFVGYRHYDTKQIAPLFPFGHGLTYTTFEYGQVSLSAVGTDQSVTAQVDITNTGARPGEEVVQFYVADAKSSLPRPSKELKGFEKVELLPGETKTVTVTFDARSWAFYDDSKSRWIVEPGTFQILVGASSRDIRSRTTLDVI